MNQLCSIFSRLGLRLVLLALFLAPTLASAQYFTDTGYGDVNAGFRKTGSHQEADEIVAYLGNVTNFLALTPGTTITCSNFNTVVLTNMCPDGFNYLQWLIFASFTGPASWTTTLGVFPGATTWYTVARTNVNIQTQPVYRFSSGSAPSLESQILGVPDGAYAIASEDLLTTNINNNTLAVLEPINDGPQYLLDSYLGDNGDFGGTVINFSVENNTSNSFTAPVVSDFYQNVPTTTSHSGTKTDPITGLTNGPAYYVGYFTLYTSGKLTFTRASATVAAPSVGTVTASVTNGFGGLTVVFTNTASGGITNWVWNFGNGTIITNTTGGNVTNTYATAGSYTVTLAVYGPGIKHQHNDQIYCDLADTEVQPDGSAVRRQTGVRRHELSGGGAYRILSTTNVALVVTNWIPVATNTFLANGSYSFTNFVGNSNVFYRLVSLLESG